MPADVRLFDRGDFNTYTDEINFVRVLSKELMALVEAVTLDGEENMERSGANEESMLPGRISKSIRTKEDLFQLCENLASDIKDLEGKMPLGGEAVFVQQSKLSGIFIEAFRKKSALRWLDRLLNKTRSATDRVFEDRICGQLLYQISY